MSIKKLYTPKMTLKEVVVELIHEVNFMARLDPQGFEIIPKLNILLEEISKWGKPAK
jgi:hypothetical protein